MPYPGFIFLLTGISLTVNATCYVRMFKLDVVCILPVILLHSVTKTCALMINIMFKVKIKGLFPFCFPTLTCCSFKCNPNRKAVNTVLI